MTVDGKDHHPQDRHTTTAPPWPHPTTLAGLSASFNRQQTTKAIVINRPPTPRLPLHPAQHCVSVKGLAFCLQVKNELQPTRTQQK